MRGKERKRGQRAGPQGFRDEIPLRCSGGSWKEFMTEIGVSRGEEDEPVSSAGPATGVQLPLPGRSPGHTWLRGRGKR